MSEIIIKAADLSKIYKVYEKPADRLLEALFRKKRHTDFQPLKDINFILNRGESLGIIGENGAGKSTLLKVLAGTLEPTSGSIEKRGTTAALLELGAGFHPEFTGRQNIKLNASLLGMTDSEIQAKEAEIIEFSELGDFIDRPVKTYSSGMYVRLGFSIATSVNPNVLIVDEALSVGDVSFQKKCVRRILDFQKNQTSILFCSHNLHQVQEVCDKSIWIHKGEMMAFGNSNEVVGHYLNFLEARSKANQKAANSAPTKLSLKPKLETDTAEHQDHPTDVAAVIKDIRLLNSAGEKTDNFAPLDKITIEFDVLNLTNSNLLMHAGVRLTTINNEVASISSTKLSGSDPFVVKNSATIRLVINKAPLNFGNYPFTLLIGDENSLVIYDEKHGGVININRGRAEYGNIFLDAAWTAQESL